MFTNESIKQMKRRLADDIFHYYYQSFLPSEIYESIAVNSSLSMPGSDLIDRGVLLSNDKYTIIYECAYCEGPDDEDFDIQNSYTISYLFLDERTRTVCDIDALFDVWSEDSELTMDFILAETKEEYLQRIKESIQDKINLYHNPVVAGFNLKKNSALTIYRQQNMIQTLFPELYAQIPEEIFSINV